MQRKRRRQRQQHKSNRITYKAKKKQQLSTGRTVFCTFLCFRCTRQQLPSLKCSFSRSKRQSVGCKWNLQPATRFHVKRSFLHEINLYDLALCIDNNDNHMTFGGHIVYLWPESQMSNTPGRPESGCLQPQADQV